MIVCVCANVSDRAIARAVREGFHSVESVTMATGACSGCGQCRAHCEAEIQAQHAVALACNGAVLMSGCLAHS